MGFFDKLSARKKGVLLAILGILGILLVIFGTFGEERKKNSEQEGSITKKSSTMEYIAELENKIGNITKQITGSEMVRVMVNLASGTEYVYVSNEEQDEKHSSKEYVSIRTEDGANELILLKEICPKVTGVSVVCRGGDDPVVQAKLIRVISTALGITSNRICIVGIP